MDLQEKVIVDYYPPRVFKAVEALMTRPGQCTPELRQAIEAYAASLSGGSRQVVNIPETLVPYVNKVTLYAYKVTDEDVQQLKDAGYSEDAIYEITLCASLGASLARLEKGLQIVIGGA